MCLAIPAKVIEVQGNTAKVDFGEGIVREVDVMLVEAKVGEYVLVHQAERLAATACPKETPPSPGGRCL